jgi:hypothetical protein
MTSVNDFGAHSPPFCMVRGWDPSMPMFYFDVIRGEETGRDEVGVHAEDVGAAMREALRRCELLRAVADAAQEDWRDWLVVTRDETRAFIFALRLSAVMAKVPPPGPTKKRPATGAGQSEGRN